MLSRACAPPDGAAQNSDGEQEQQGADSRVDDRCYELRSEVDVKFRQDPAADEGSANSYDNIPENSESYPFHKMAHEPSRNETHCNYDNQVFAHHLHYFVPTLCITLHEAAAHIVQNCSNFCLRRLCRYLLIPQNGTGRIKSALAWSQATKTLGNQQSQCHKRGVIR